MLTMIHHFLASLFICLSLVCCQAADRVVVGQTFLAASEDPRSDSVPWALVSHGIAEKLFTVDQNDDIIPQIAESVTKVDDDGTIWEITLKSGYRFSDGTEVDAQHVANSLLEINSNNENAQASLGAMTVTASSALTVRIESERPTHVMEAVLAEWVFVIYYQDNGRFIYTGPYVVEHIGEDDHIDLTPNPFYPQAEERSKIKLEKFADGFALANALLQKKLDVAFHLPIEKLQEIRDTEGLNVRTFEVGYHYMVFYNTQTSPMNEYAVRKAVDLVIDRDALSQVLRGGKGTRSFFPDFSPYYTDDSDAHGKVDEANAILEEAGWIFANGKRTRDGQDLSIDLVAYPQRPGLVIMQPEIKKQLESVGIIVRSKLTSQDWQETQDIIDAKDFDMLMWAQHTLPAGDPAWFLNAFFRTDGANNHAGYASSEVDALLDTLAMTENQEDRIMASEAVHDKIVADLPMSNLVTPAWHVGLSDRVVDAYDPWGSDYYVIRADTFLGMELQDDASAAAGRTLFTTVVFVVAALL